MKKRRGKMEKKKELGSYGCVLVPARKGFISAVVRRGMTRTMRLLHTTSCQSRRQGRGGFLPVRLIVEWSR